MRLKNSTHETKESTDISRRIDAMYFNFKRRVDMIDNNLEGREQFGIAYGAEDLYISKKQVEELLNGKTIAVDVNCGEYSVFISLDDEEED
ncbi:MAG: hypothetical protein MJZ20_01650 [Bacteroidaceae bacterium]|nr:hypothetical protein [Bacteroidaceae bacterium]